eukprot:PLAT4939.2.p1 GENE.PLAT4939.2~~PLAT4939.2.p1  ORF type:complete len:259 (-),score=84.16 PLAT4939.2:76-822(-)
MGDDDAMLDLLAGDDGGDSPADALDADGGDDDWDNDDAALGVLAGDDADDAHEAALDILDGKLEEADDEDTLSTIGDLQLKSTASKYSDIHEAVWAGDYAAVERMLARDSAACNAKDRSEFGGCECEPGKLDCTCDTYTALHYAAYRGDLPMVELLLAAGADVGAVNAEGCTAFYLACQQGHGEVALLLLKKGAALDSTDSVHGFAALEVADRELLRMLAKQLRLTRPAPPTDVVITNLRSRSLTVEW